MNKLLKSFLLGVVATFLVAGSAMAIPVDITYTADNIADTWFIQGETGIAANMAAGINRADWRYADIMTVDLVANQDYAMVWSVTNIGDFAAGNPAAFLAEIDLGDSVVLSSVEWTYSKYGFNTADFDANTWDWTNVTEYGNNGGTNIWTQVFGQAVEGISTEAQWIWSENNFVDGTEQNLFIRVDIHTAPVPEPATMLLFGMGLLGLAGITRKRTKA